MRDACEGALVMNCELVRIFCQNHMMRLDDSLCL